MGTQRLEAATILDAAAEEFARHGFEGLSMRVLAERCHATAAALYHHFSAKEALYDEEPFPPPMIRPPSPVSGESP